VSADFSEVVDAFSALQHGLNLSMKNDFPGRAMQVEVKYDKGGSATLSIDLGARRTTDEERRVIERHARRIYRDLAGAVPKSVFILDAGAQDATDPQILRALRILGPSDLQQIHMYLKSQDLGVASDEWLNRRMDYMRQKGLVTYLGQGMFSLSGTALLAMPARASGRGLIQTC
jgi:hypothetical protein